MDVLKTNNKFILAGLAGLMVILMFVLKVFGMVTVFDIFFKTGTKEVILGILTLGGLVGAVVVQFLGLDDKKKYLFAVIGFGVATLALLLVLIDAASLKLDMALLILVILGLVGTVLNVLHLVKE